MILCKNCSPRKECFYYQNGENRTECKFYKPMTEQEYIQTCNTEQLADVLADVSLWIHPFMKQKNRFELLKKQFYEWLKKPHREE